MLFHLLDSFVSEVFCVFRRSLSPKGNCNYHAAKLMHHFNISKYFLTFFYISIVFAFFLQFQSPYFYQFSIVKNSIPGSAAWQPCYSVLEPGLLANPAVWMKIAPDGEPRSGVRFEPTVEQKKRAQRDFFAEPWVFAAPTIYFMGRFFWPSAKKIAP